VMIAIALACEPLLLIADEPTTALDVTIQAQILQLLKSLGEKRGLATLLISHDLGIVSEMAHRVMVMYAGQVVESAPADSLLSRPRHPYTRGLLASLPRVDRRLESLVGIEGRVPAPGECLTGCRFRERCPKRRPACSQDQSLRSIASSHLVRCDLVEG
jgi:peptide/nickel transport system ATP-binding protein